MKPNYFVPYALWFLLLLPLSTYAQGINNGSGSFLVANGNISIVIENGGLKNDGTFVKSTSTVHFSGNNATSASAISGTGSLDFYNLTMNKSANGIQLNRDIDLSGSLNFLSGDSIFLNNHIVNLGTTGSITGERATSRFTGLNGGYVMITQTLNAPVLANPGNIGIEITSAANLGSTTVKRSHGIFKNASIKRSFEIIPANNSGLDASLNFYYFLPELNGISEVLLSTYASTNSGSNWNYATNIVPNTTSHYITSNNISSLSLLTLFPTGIDLPVELLYFKGINRNNSNFLSWTTATEQNNAYFTIERSADGAIFEEIGKVSGAGNSSSIISYQYEDKSPLTGKNYYRLKQTDFNSEYKYSLTLILYNSTGNKYLQISPNPVTAILTINIENNTSDKQSFIIIDCFGKTVKRLTISNCAQPVTKISIPVNDLSPGNYYLKAEGTFTNSSISFMKL